MSDLLPSCIEPEPCLNVLRLSGLKQLCLLADNTCDASLQDTLSK